VSSKNVEKKDQKINRLTGEKLKPVNSKFEARIGNRNKIITDNKSAITPPSLLGMERRIAYANKKYHSG